MIRSLLLAALLLTTACGVRGSLSLPKDPNAPTTQAASSDQATPQKKERKSHPSVQKSDEERELLNDPFFEMRSDGEFDIRGNLNRSTR